MYCHECGRFFPAADVVEHYDRFTGAHESCCPYCGETDIVESEECSDCGKEYVYSEISHGFCLKCLWNAIDYDVAFAYMMASIDGVADFILNCWFGGDLSGSVTERLEAFIEETFRRLVANERLMQTIYPGYKTDKPFLAACRKFCLPDYDDGIFGLDGHNFAAWYAKHGKDVKKDD